MNKIQNLFMFIFFLIILIIIFVPKDKEWVDCSDEKDLYRYVSNGWKVDKVLKKGDYVKFGKGTKHSSHSKNGCILLVILFAGTNELVC